MRVQVFFKNDGHHLPMWKTCVKVDAPPAEACQFIVNKRRLWDPLCMDARVVEQLDEKSDIFQYVCDDGLMPRDYCVLR